MKAVERIIELSRVIRMGGSMVFIISVVLDFDHLKISVPQLNASIKVCLNCL